MVTTKGIRLAGPTRYLPYCCCCRSSEDELKAIGKILTSCPHCKAAKFCTSCRELTFTTAHYCREISAKQEKLQSLEASYVRAQRPSCVPAAPQEIDHLLDEVLWCAAQLGNSYVEMAHTMFPTIQEGAFLYDQALQIYQRAVQEPGLSWYRRKAIESQMLLLLVLLDRDDQVMRFVTRIKTADRYDLLCPDKIRELAMDSGTLPFILFCIKAKIVGLARTMKPKLDEYLQTRTGQMVEEAKYEIADFLYGHSQLRVRNQAAQIATVGPALLLERRDGTPMVFALLNEMEKFEKADWHLLFRNEVPPVYWSVFRRYVLGHTEIQSSLTFLVELLETYPTTERVFDMDKTSSQWLQEVMAL